jgi:putative ABC transport system permease protein
MVRAATDPLAMVGAIRSEVSNMDKDQPIISVKPMTQLVDESLAKPRFNMLLLSLFAGLAVVLASVGIFGVITYSVSQRTHEIGIRMALGAKRVDVLKLVIAQGMRLVAIGILLGGVSAFLLTRIMTDLLYGVSPTDPTVFWSISILLILVSLLACYLPARKATLVDPMMALHYE